MEERCGAASGPITGRMIAYQGVLLGLVGKMFQGGRGKVWCRGRRGSSAGVECGRRAGQAGQQEQKGGLWRVN